MSQEEIDPQPYIGHIAIPENMPWYTRAEYVSYYLEKGDALLDAHSYDHIYVLGQSLSWLFKISEIVHQKPSQVVHIPFSGRFHAPSTAEHSVNKVFKNNEEVPSDDQIKHYREILTQQGLSPEQIKQRASNQEKTVLIDYLSSGAGMASFLSIILDWGKECGVSSEVLASMKIITFGAKCTSITIPGYEAIKVHWNPYDTKLFPLVNDRTEYPLFSTGISPIEDRLVPHYPFKKWTIDPPPIGNDAEIKEITNAITQCLEKAHSATEEDLKKSYLDNPIYKPLSKSDEITAQYDAQMTRALENLQVKHGVDDGGWTYFNSASRARSVFSTKIGSKN